MNKGVPYLNCLKSNQMLQALSSLHYDSQTLKINELDRKVGTVQLDVNVHYAT
jgi:hypothetical protein